MPVASGTVAATAARGAAAVRAMARAVEAEMTPLIANQPKQRKQH
eukprot:COSAG05_NODE_11275_length_521_cov_2.324645_1_plen_44_part_10